MTVQILVKYQILLKDSFEIWKLRRGDGPGGEVGSSSKVSLWLQLEIDTEDFMNQYMWWWFLMAFQLRRRVLRGKVLTFTLRRCSHSGWWVFFWLFGVCSFLSSALFYTTSSVHYDLTPSCVCLIYPFSSFISSCSVVSALLIMDHLLKQPGLTAFYQSKAWAPKRIEFAIFLCIPGVTILIVGVVQYKEEAELFKFRKLIVLSACAVLITGCLLFVIKVRPHCNHLCHHHHHYCHPH